jgi:hypothetical protein
MTMTDATPDPTRRALLAFRRSKLSTTWFCAVRVRKSDALGYQIQLREDK